MLLSREIEKKKNCVKIIPKSKTYIFEILIKIRSIKHSSYYVTRTSNNGKAVYWSRDTRDNDTALLLAEVLVT